MGHPSTDPSYLADQYDDSEKLRIRAETHARYTVGKADCATTDLHHLALRRGQVVLDAGCGPGRLAGQGVGPGVSVVGIDRSFGMLREASSLGWSGAQADAAVRRFAACAQADVVALPFADATFDRVAALGVLYHVRPWPVALAEMRRVCRPSGGRVVVSTNGRDAMRRLLDLHAEAARELGYIPLEPTAATFSLEDLDTVRAILPSVQRYILESALVFRSTAPALGFYATNRIDLIEDRPRDASHRPLLLAAVGRKIEAIIAREGTFTVPKVFGYFVADL